MHLSLISRGSQRDVVRFIEEIQSKYVPMKVGDIEGKCNIIYRPIQLGELIFPEPSLQTVLKTLQPMNRNRKGFYFDLLRKSMNLEKVPKLDNDSLPFPVWCENIEMVLLGIKKDIFKDGYEHL